MKILLRGPAAAAFLIPALALTSCQFENQGGHDESSTASVVVETPSGLVATWVEMWNAYDLDQVGVLFLTDDRVSYFSSEYEGVMRGYQAVLDHHRGFGFVPGGAEKGTRLWVEDLTEDVFGETAVLTGIWYFQREGSGAEGEGAQPQRGPVTFVCVLEDGRWRFAHMNFGNYLDSEES